MDTKPGKLRFSLPRPYSTHEPTDGLMNVVEPQCRNSVAGPCATPSVCIEWMKHRSSTCFDISGKSSDTQRPLWPCFVNDHGDLSTRCEVPRAPVFAMFRASSKPIILPSCRASAGL